MRTCAVLQPCPFVHLFTLVLSRPEAFRGAGTAESTWAPTCTGCCGSRRSPQLRSPSSQAPSATCRACWRPGRAVRFPPCSPAAFPVSTCGTPRPAAPRPAPPRICDPTSGLPAVRAPGPPRSSAATLATPAHSESHASPVAAFSVRLALEAGPSATPSAVKFFSFLASAPDSCHPPCGFQGSGPGLEAPGTSSPRPASWALR